MDVKHSAVSIVIPALDDRALLERGLPPLLAEIDARALGDELLVVDDTGRGELAAWLARHEPRVQLVIQPFNSGFARALRAGVQAARHPLVFSMNPDVLVRPGFLTPLVEALAEPSVAAVVPRLLLNGEEHKLESLAYLRQGPEGWFVEQPALEGGASFDPARTTALGERPVPVSFAVGGACLMRRAEFLEGGGFDPLFEPFYWEDVDWGIAQWRAGKRVLLVPASTVEHHHRGTIGRVVPEPLVRAAIEKNRLLFAFKQLDQAGASARNLERLYGSALEAYLSDQRDELIWLCLALEQGASALRGRAEQAPGQTLEQVLRRIDESRRNP